VVVFLIDMFAGVTLVIGETYHQALTHSEKFLDPRTKKNPNDSAISEVRWMPSQLKEHSLSPLPVFHK